MKTRYLLFGLTMLIMVLGACREISVSTLVNTDGTFTRTITVSGDSDEVFKMDLPYPLDASWTMTSRKETTNKEKYIVTYTKHFGNSEELEAEIGRDTSWKKQLVRHIDIRKRFGFFYSYIGYREVYLAANPFTALPSKDHLTPEDMDWITGRHSIQSPSDSVNSKAAEDKALKYLVESATAEVEKILTDGILKLNDPRLDAKRVPEFRDSIRIALSADKMKEGASFIDAYRMWSGNPAADRLKELQPPLFLAFEKKTKFLENLLLMEGFHAEAGMPGLITATNSTALSGNRVGWDIFPMAFLFEDYPMTAESRVINVWAFILTGMVLLGLVILLVIKSLKR